MIQKAVFNPVTGSGSFTTSKPVNLQSVTWAELFGTIPPRRVRLHKPEYTMDPDGNFRVNYPFTLLAPRPESPGLAAYVDAVLDNG